MFHVKRRDYWQRAALWSGHNLDDRSFQLLDRYLLWLEEEALPAGGLGSGEKDRIPRRHIADSLLFALILEPDTAEVWDLGSGVGLPGIPLAILRPDVSFVLLDRSGKRVDLIHRAVRILELANVRVEHGEMADLEVKLPVIVSRATSPPEKAAVTLYHLLQSPGVALWGGSWQGPPRFDPWETVTVPPSVLDHEVWLLKMRRA